VAKIFLSYVEEDSDVARQVADGLEESGYTVWYYGRDSLPGPSYIDQILEAIDRAEAVVVVLSPATLGSSQVNIEISRAHSARKPFAPLLHGLALSTLRAEQGSWAMMFGNAVAAPIPAEGVAAIMSRLERGLRTLGVEPGPDGDRAGIVTQRKPPLKPGEPGDRLDTGKKGPEPVVSLSSEPKTRSGVNAAVVLGYVFAVLTLVTLPIVFGPIGVGFGIYNVVKGRTVHGVAQIVLSVVLGVFSAIVGAMMLSV
jgi:hypothetical protein